MNYDQFRQECMDFRSRDGNGQAKLESILHRIALTRDMASADDERYDEIVKALSEVTLAAMPKPILDTMKIWARRNAIGMRPRDASAHPMNARGE